MRWTRGNERRDRWSVPGGPERRAPTGAHRDASTVEGRGREERLALGVHAPGLDAAGQVGDGELDQQS
jgi:hypothetical protein